MTGLERRILGVVATVGLLGTLSSCSQTASKTAATVSPTDPEFYWSAAKDRYAAGDYVKAISHLDHLLNTGNPYLSRALPFSLALTSGMAAGYTELADYYAAGAKANKGRSTVFLQKVADYRALANHMVLGFAENAKKLDLIEGDSLQLAFGPPKGNAFEPKVFTTISHGILPSKEDQDGALELALDRGVLFTICSMAGAPNNLAKASEILQKGEFLVRRGKFMRAVADLLDHQSQLYARTKMDDSAKLAMLQKMSADALKDADAPHTAMVMQVPGH